MEQARKEGILVSFIPWGSLFRQVGWGKNLGELGIIGKNHWVLKGQSERQFNTRMSKQELDQFETVKPAGEELNERLGEF